MRLTPVVKNLLILNILFYVVAYLDRQYGIVGDPEWLSNFLALYFFESPLFRPVQLVTHFFMHGGMMHIFFNMFALAMFGPPLEIMLKPQRFLTYYIICAFGSVALHMGFTWWELSQMQDTIHTFIQDPTIEAIDAFFKGVPLSDIRLDDGSNMGSVVNGVREQIRAGNLDDAARVGSNMMDIWYNFKRDIPMVGASGAIYGLLLAFGMYFPDFKLMLIFLPIPIKARYFIPVLMAIELILGFSRIPGDNIAHFAHLGGALIGFLVILYWRKFNPPSSNRWN